MPLVVIMIVVMVTVVVMVMVTRRHIFVFHVIHTTNRALAGRIAATPFAVHWADIGSRVLLALFAGICLRTHMVHVVPVFHMPGFLRLFCSRVALSVFGIATTGNNE